MICDGRVTLDGTVVREPGQRVDSATSRILVDGRPLPAPPTQFRTIMLHKPRGLICSADASQGQTVFACLPDFRERLVPVGRLDKDSEGLLLLSNDGDLVNRLTHPRYGCRKEYLVTVSGAIDERTLQRLSSPMTLPDGTRYLAAEVALVDSRPHESPPRHRLLIRIGEGRNRQVRRMCEAVGLTVERLIRQAIGGLQLPPDLAPGEWRDLTPHDFARLTSGRGCGKMQRKEYLRCS